MDTGWIKIFRQITEWEWYTNANTMRVFIHLLLKANYERKRWQGIEILPGQVVSSYEKIAEQLGIKAHCVRTAINHLKNSGEITQECHSKYSLFKLNNHSRYQADSTQVLTHDSGKTQSSGNNIRKKEYKNNKKKEESGEKFPTTPPSEIFLDFVSDVRTKSENYEKLVQEITMRTRLEDSKVRAELDKFVNYWTEKNQTGKKERWQMQPTFETQRRLATWFSNMKNNASFTANKEKKFSFIS